jgi:hypothetical protein
MSDLEILDHAFLASASSEQVVNYVEARIDELVQMIQKKPLPPTDELTAKAHHSWRNRLLIHYGRCMESLLAAQAWGHISVEQYQKLKVRLDAAIHWKMAEALLGGLG